MELVCPPPNSHAEAPTPSETVSGGEALGASRGQARPGEQGPHDGRGAREEHTPQSPTSTT